MTGLAQLIEESRDAVGDTLEVALLGVGEPVAVAADLERLCLTHLGEPRRALLYNVSVGIVVGWELVDGSRVVVKLHRYNVSAERLGAIRAVQQKLHDDGLPAPRPLLGPLEWGSGLAMVERHLPGGTIDARRPAARVEIAVGLHALVRAARPLVGAVDVGRPGSIRSVHEPLWPEPHSLRFDFEATAEGAEWIDELAREARARSAPTDLPDVIGHFDWRAGNLGFVDGRLAAIYDWDSLAAAPEAFLVGSIAASFCVDWSRGERDPFPSVADMLAFVADYEQARGAPFFGDDLVALDAGNLIAACYGARCQHSDLRRYPELDHGGVGWLRLLRERGDRCW